MVGSRPIEITAVICGLINVSLIIRRSIWNYPFGFVMVVLYAKIFYDYQLYSDALLQVYYFFIQFYGLWFWLKGREDDGKIIVEFLPKTQYLSYLMTAVVGWLILSTLMANLTDASYPYWDGSIAVLSVLAQFLLSRRNIESWYLWIIVDVLAIGLFVVKDLTPTAALYGVFLVLAIIGLFQWKAKAKLAAS
ncbi:nicotinamide mononucleotide transporter [Amylibacter sp. SFDW26]|nr:nicotinamide riboside transporter PnuC [Amylibacter sp. SFDW26]KAB7616418.1 nicotinamide mononucleotide transporter [Amylibacter sp. SFDW26]